MNYTKNYNHLTYDERAFIEIQIKSGYSIRSIARQLNRSPIHSKSRIKTQHCF
nr:helix-turn-helix domain-containing protein [Mycoplasmopsis bovis]